MSRILDPAVLKALVCAVEQKLRGFTTSCHDEGIRSSPEMKRVSTAVQDLRAYIEGDMDSLWRRERQRTQALEEELRRLRASAALASSCSAWEAQPAYDRGAALRALLAANRTQPPVEQEPSPLAAACAAMLRARPVEPTEPSAAAAAAGGGGGACAGGEPADGDEDLYS